MYSFILTHTFPPADSGKPEASIQHELNLQECDPGGLGPGTVHPRHGQGQ